MMQNRASAVFCICLLFLPPILTNLKGKSNSANEIASIYKNGKRLVLGVNSVKAPPGSRISIIIKVEPFPADSLLKSSFFWGTFGNAPRAILCDFKIFNKDQPIPIKSSAYIDLSNPSCADVKCNKEEIVVSILGGDAFTSYIACWKFSPVSSYGYLLKERLVRLSEFPKNLERTLFEYDPDQTK